MKLSAIICEYNPFHNGHKYQIEKIKEYSDNPVVAIMSGNFTQRGDVAILDKFKRAEIAIKNGVDIVIELPTVYALANAETFAKAGVQLTKSLGCVENLCFSAEESDPDLLYNAANEFKNSEFNSCINELMKSGDYYPRAVQKAFEQISPEYAEVFSKPNNILAVEYIKALNGSDIKPYIIKRIGAEHDTSQCKEGITSASNIRKMILENDSSAYKYMPCSDAIKHENTADIKNLESVIMYKLRTMSREDFSRLPDVNEGLENRVYDCARNSCSLDELFELAKTKRYTMARLRRIIICAMLNITADSANKPVPYIRVLAFNDIGSKALHDIAKSCTLPLITNVADGYKKLNNKASSVFNTDLLASDIYSVATQNIKPCGEDFTRGIIKI